VYGASTEKQSGSRITLRSWTETTTVARRFPRGERLTFYRVAKNAKQSPFNGEPWPAAPCVISDRKLS